MTQREPNESDRLINARGYSQDFLDALCGIADDVNDPGCILCIGEQKYYEELLSQILPARPDLKDKRIFAYKPELENPELSKKIPFSLASSECLNWLLNHTNRNGFNDGDKIKAVILFHQQGQEQYLESFLAKTNIRVYRLIDTLPNGPMEVADWEDRIPSNVDLTADGKCDDHTLRQIPSAALFGFCRELAEQMQCSVGYAYPAVLAAVSTYIQPNCNIRPNIYVGLLGRIHNGKSVTANRAFQLCGLQDEQGNPLGLTLVDATPASDRGLYKLFPEKDLCRRLLYADEGRNMMGKGNIQGSTLITVFNELYNRNRAGVADKFGSNALNVQLSLLANFTVTDAAQFPEIFTHATSHGLWDRFLFGFRGDEEWHYRPWQIDPDKLEKIEPSQPTVAGKIFDRVHEWARATEGRGRLAEIALRVAYITSAVSQEDEVNDAAMDAALCLMEWQEEIRRLFQPAKGANEYEEAMQTILSAFRRAPGRAANWRELNRKERWYEKFPRSYLHIKSTLEKDKILVVDKKSKKHYLVEDSNDSK
jgi:hypothetical protein